MCKINQNTNISNIYIKHIYHIYHIYHIKARLENLFFISHVDTFVYTNKRKYYIGNFGGLFV